jgi:bacillithiol biosynthesis deacetylase BshB1
MDRKQKVDILCIGAHPDDVELSCSGTILKHIAMGKTVAIVDLTRGELGSKGSADIRDKEAAAAAEILGIEARMNLGMADGFFEHNQENLIKVVEAIRYFQPEVVLCNALSDRHPDHGKGGKLVSEACFLSGLLRIETEYEGVKQKHCRPKAVYHYIQDRFLGPDFVVDISDYYETKMKSILAYSSQFYNPDDKTPHTPISSPEFLEYLKGRMTEFGRQIGTQYAEGFIKERPIGVKDITKLL